MGVKLLSKLLKQECKDVSKKYHLSELYGKKICIDASIYLYRFKCNNTLIESIFNMCSIFRKYNIDVVFVFDGKPGVEKTEELNIRREERYNKWVLYDKLKEKKEKKLLTDKEKTQLYKLKRTLTKIKSEDIVKVKNLLDAYGIKYIQANSEADTLCASLVNKKKVFGVLSEDMDLFAYGSLNVLRYFSLAAHTVIVYNYKQILEKLNIENVNFKLLCVLAGNDYIKNEKNIFYYFILYQKYKKKKLNITWINWLLKNNHITSDNYDNINKTYQLFTLSGNELCYYKYFIVKNTRYDIDKIVDLLRQERFLIF